MAEKYREYKQLDLPAFADEVLDFWKKENIFQKSISSRPENKPFVFFEGPPSANGMPGIHHVMARTIKDIFCRYKTLQGYRVERKAGWDTHGLPVELGVEKELGITKEDIGKKISVEEYNAACRKAVMKYTDVWNDLTEKMGYWVDMENPYVTYENKYIESVWWLLQQIFNKNLLYKGYTIQPYSPAAGTGLSSHELNQPGCYRDVKDTTVTAQFKISPSQTFPKGKDFLKSLLDEGREVFLLAWTTTPWTLPSNTALAVGPKIDYVLVSSFNQYTHQPINVVLAKALVNYQFNGKYELVEDESAFSEYSEASKKIPFKIIKEFTGSDLVGLKYEQLLPYALPYENAENAFQLIPGDFVTTEDGTGIVHIAPTFGADDAKVAKDAGVPPMLVLDENGNPVPLVDLQGKFRSELPEIGGKYVKNEYYEDGKAPEKSVDVEIAIKLKEDNKAFKVEKYEHSYPHCWRTDKPVLYYPLDSWFIKVTAFKDRMVELNKTINWKPKATGEGRFGNWLENANDWNLSRSRFWGIPLPIWRTEDATEVICIGSVEQLKAECDKAVAAGLMEKNPLAAFEVGNMSKENYDTFDLHKNVVDKIVLVSESGRPMQREADLIDVWFDSGSMPYAQWHYPFENSSLIDLSPTLSKGEGVKTPKYETARASSYHLFKELAKEHKKIPTQAEDVLWQCLRGKKLENFKFRRQHIIDEFIVDFLCQSKGLIIEVDGKYHEKPEINEADELRTKILEEDLGYKVIRFTNEEVIGNIDGILQKILETLNELPSFGGAGGGKVFPADYIAEGVDQTRGWFYTLHAIATVCFDSVAYKNVISNGLVLDKNGQKMSKRLGNAVDPFETLKKYGPDATRWYMITNAQPWDNLKFDLDGIVESQRKFFGTLYNTYSFFALYSNIDSFKYKEEEIALEKRQEIDRWIISKLHSLIKNVELALNDYEPTKAGRLIEDFVTDHLSNWYVRLCRRRFWKGDYSEDKIAAYQTLYTCLETVAKLAAPISPFFMDKLYQDLNNCSGKENHQSVHLSEFPTYNDAFIDADLEQKMDWAQQISSMVLSLRKKEQIKVRQPLQKIMIPILNKGFADKVTAVKDVILSEVNVKELELLTDTAGVLVKKIKPNFKTIGPKYGKQMKAIATMVNGWGQEEISAVEQNNGWKGDINGDTIELTMEDFDIQTDDIPGWLVQTEKGITVALDITLSEELKEEGIAREFVNRIQNFRKDKGFEVTDKILLTIQEHKDINSALKNNKNYICTETLATELQLVDNIDANDKLEVALEDDVKTFISISKLN